MATSTEPLTATLVLPEVRLHLVILLGMFGPPELPVHTLLTVLTP